MKWITNEQIDELIEQARNSERGRSHMQVHAEHSDPVQRLFIGSMKNSYYRPHRHSGKWELAVAIRGAIDLLIFNDEGILTERRTMGSDVVALELPPDAWHTWVPVSDELAFFETKMGPYDPATASEFAPWSPAEGTPEAADFFNKLQTARVGDQFK